MAEEKQRVVRILPPGPDEAPTLYANHMRIDVSTHDFRLRFGQIESLSEDNVLSVRERVHIYMSVSHARATMEALKRVLASLDAKEIIESDE